jgi:hypothetical protein
MLWQTPWYQVACMLQLLQPREAGGKQVRSDFCKERFVFVIELPALFFSPRRRTWHTVPYLVCPRL